MTCHICAKTNCIGECEPKIQLDDINVVDMSAQQEQDMPKIGCVNHDCDKCKEHPAQRTRVGLTKTVVGNYLRIHALGDQPTFRQGFKEGVAFAEAKLKEKNT